MRTRQAITMMSMVVLLVGAASCMAGQDLPALKDLFKNDFLMSGAYTNRDRGKASWPSLSHTTKHTDPYLAVHIVFTNIHNNGVRIIHRSSLKTPVPDLLMNDWQGGPLPHTIPQLAETVVHVVIRDQPKHRSAQQARHKQLRFAFGQHHKSNNINH